MTKTRAVITAYLAVALFTYGHAYNYHGEDALRRGVPLGEVRMGGAMASFMPALLWPLYWSTFVVNP